MHIHIAVLQVIAWHQFIFWHISIAKVPLYSLHTHIPFVMYYNKKTTYQQ